MYKVSERRHKTCPEEQMPVQKQRETTATTTEILVSFLLTLKRYLPTGSEQWYQGNFISRSSVFTVITSSNGMIPKSE